MKKLKLFFVLLIGIFFLPGLPMFIGHIHMKEQEVKNKKAKVEVFMKQNLGKAHYVYPNDDHFLGGDYVYQVEKSDFYDTDAWFDNLPSQIHKDIVLGKLAKPMVVYAKDGRIAHNMRLAYDRVAYRVN